MINKPLGEKERAEIAAAFADLKPSKDLLAKYRRRERREIKAAADTFIRAAKNNDLDLLSAALGNLEYKPDAWRQILRQDYHPSGISLGLLICLGGGGRCVPQHDRKRSCAARSAASILAAVFRAGR